MGAHDEAGAAIFHVLWHFSEEEIESDEGG